MKKILLSLLMSAGLVGVLLVGTTTPANAQWGNAYCATKQGNSAKFTACGTTNWVNRGTSGWYIDGLQLCAEATPFVGGYLRQSKDNHYWIIAPNGQYKGTFPNVANGTCTYKYLGIVVPTGSRVVMWGTFDKPTASDAPWVVCAPLIAGYPASTNC